jgi:hypothetical protein
MTSLRRGHLLLFTLFLAQPMNAQQSKPALDTAPVPPAIAAAKKVFISNAGEDNLSGGFGGELFAGGSNRCYDEFYQEVESLKRFEMVSSPAAADIVFEIRLTPLEGRRSSSAVLRLRILDPKTRIVLWSFYERTRSANLRRTLNKNLDIAIKQIVSDLKSVIEAPSKANP